MDDKTTLPKYKRRSSAQIIMSLLDYLDKHQKAKKTWLLNESHMNSKTFEPHFKQILEKHYIEIEGGFFKLTEIGKLYLYELKRVNNFDSIGSILQYKFRLKPEDDSLEAAKRCLTRLTEDDPYKIHLNLEDDRWEDIRRRLHTVVYK